MITRLQMQERYYDGSKYESNLKRVMGDLVKNAASSGFNTTSHGENAEEKVYGLLQCREDASPQECSKFSQEASITLPQLGGNAIGGRLWLDMCFLHYNNVGVFSDLDAHASSSLSNSHTVKDNPGGFQNAVMELLPSRYRSISPKSPIKPENLECDYTHINKLIERRAPIGVRSSSGELCTQFITIARNYSRYLSDCSRLFKDFDT